MTSQTFQMRIDQEEAEGLRTAASRLGLSMSDVVRGQIRGYTRQRPIYPFNGQFPSFVRDKWADAHPSTADDPQASRDRLADFAKWQKEVVPTFQEIDTSNAAAVVEPQYKPLLSSFVQDRPLFAASTRGTIASATPFTLPGSVDEATVDGSVSTHVEGTNPTPGDIAFGPQTVTPSGISGSFRITREIVDSSNPAIDVIALNVMRQSFARQTEARIFAQLNAAQAGTITDGHVPSGAMARTSTAAALPSDLRKTLAAYTDTRGRRPRAVIASSRPTVAEALEELDGSTVPAGAEDMWIVNGSGVRLSPQINGTAAGDGDVFALSSGDVFAWTSPLLELQYSEREGPGIVAVALWGYFASSVINPRGVASIRHT